MAAPSLGFRSGRVVLVDPVHVECNKSVPAEPLAACRGRNRARRDRKCHRQHVCLRRAGGSSRKPSHDPERLLEARTRRRNSKLAVGQPDHPGSRQRRPLDPALRAHRRLGSEDATHVHVRRPGREREHLQQLEPLCDLVRPERNPQLSDRTTNGHRSGPANAARDGCEQQERPLGRCSLRRLQAQRDDGGAQQRTLDLHGHDGEFAASDVDPAHADRRARTASGRLLDRLHRASNFVRRRRRRVGLGRVGL